MLHLHSLRPNRQTGAVRKRKLKSICQLSKSHKNIAVWFHQLDALPYISVSYLECGQHLVCLLIGTGGNGVSGVTVRINDRVASFPADDDGPFSPGCAVQLLHMTLLSHGSVGVTGDHCGDWKGKGNGVWDEEKVGKNSGEAGRNSDSKQINERHIRQQRQIKDGGGWRQRKWIISRVYMERGKEGKEWRGER